MKDLYAKLNLEPEASLEEVKKAYRNQVKLWHPDRFPSLSPRLQKLAHEKVREINEAYKTLETALKAETVEPDSLGNTSPSSFAPRDKILIWPNGDKYVGQTMNGIMHGQGTYFYSHGDQYTGEFRNGKPNGQGTFYYSSGDVYTGQFFDDVMNGQGTYSYANGDKYIGEFQNGRPHGKGVYILSGGGGKEFNGNWDNGEFLGG